VHLPTPPVPATPFPGGLCDNLLHADCGNFGSSNVTACQAPTLDRYCTRPPPPPPKPKPKPKPPAAPLPQGLKYTCAEGKMYTKSFVLMPHQYDYTKGFTDLASCQAVCNDLWNGKDGCLAIDWHSTDRHCVIYNGTKLTEEQWKSTQHALADYTVCMLTPTDTSTQPSAAPPGREQRPNFMVEERRRLRAMGEPVPQHCGRQGPAKKCFGDGAEVDSKQRNRIELMSRLTQTPEPDLGSMDWSDANRCERAVSILESVHVD
jgi:hypothetical protein